MHPDIDIRQHDQPTAEDVAYLSRKFQAYNDKQSGVFPSKDLHFFAYSQNEQIIGGLRGGIEWNWLHIDILWMADSYRHNGLGTMLMDRAEAEAAAMGVHQAFLETTDFQALDFYEKRGYQVFAQLEDQPPGHICYYLKKIGLGGNGEI